MKTFNPLKALLAFLVLIGSVAGCDIETFEDAASEFDNNSPAPPPPGSPPPPPPPPPGAFNATLSDIQANVFTPSCATAGCHDAGTAAAMLDLTDGASFTQLVSIPSDQDPAILRVSPNNPDDSYLIHKMEGTAAIGAVMPTTGALEQSVIDIVRQWIIDGATDDSAQPSVPIRVSSLSPAPDAALTVAPTQIVAGFDREVDQTSISPNTFIVEGSGGDGSFNEGNEVSITAASVRVPVGNPQSAIFDLAGVTLDGDTYRITLLGTGATVIQDLDGNALDGDPNFTFPSGDGVAGGNFEAEFTLTTIGPTLDQIQAVVFTPSCATAGCHSGGGAVLPTSMDLTNADASLAALVGVASQDANFPRVVAGDPDSSFLIQKLEGSQAVGGIMPPAPRQPLDAAVITEIRNWIAAGALR